MMRAGRNGLSNPRGRLAQLVRAPALQAGSRGFESLTAHHTPFQDRPIKSNSANQVQQNANISVFCCPMVYPESHVPVGVFLRVPPRRWGYLLKVPPVWRGYGAHRYGNPALEVRRQALPADRDRKS